MRTSITFTSLCISYLGLSAFASRVSIWLPTPKDYDILTLTVLQEDWTLPHTNAKDYRANIGEDKGEYVKENRLETDLSQAGFLAFDDVLPKAVRFWIRKGDIDSPTRGMTSCTATFTSKTSLEADSELLLFLASRGGTSMWEGQKVKDPNWLICGDTDLFEVPVAGTE